MKFLTYQKNGQQPHLGVLIDQNRVLDLTRAGESYLFFHTMNDLIMGGEEAVNIVNGWLNSPPEPFIDQLDSGEVRILPPIGDPGHNVYCVGLNYFEHNKEFTGKDDAAAPEYPIIFTKSRNSLIGHDETIKSHSEITQELDYEAELGVVLGKGGRNISRENALDYVFGYTIINDITARDLQRNHKQWFLGKSLDTFCPIGPWIVHKSALPKPENDLNISSKVNGEIRQSSNTKHMIFDIPSIISIISTGHTLEPGNMIATGTCEGVGMGFHPPKYLKPGDRVEVEVEGIGVLRNDISEE